MRINLFAALCGIAALFLSSRTAAARPIIYTAYEKVANAHLIVVAEVTHFQTDVAIICRSLEVLKGDSRQGQLRLAWKPAYNKTVETAGLSMAPGDRRVLFLTRDSDGSLELFGGPQGSMSDDLGHKHGVIRQLVAVDAAQDATAKGRILSAMLRSSAPGRALALEALMRLDIAAKDEDLNANVVACLEDTNFAVRRDAAYVAGKLHIENAKPLLLKKSQHEHPAVQSAAAAALRSIDR